MLIPYHTFPIECSHLDQSRCCGSNLEWSVRDLTYSDCECCAHGNLLLSMEKFQIKHRTINELRYVHFWRRWKAKWKRAMGFASINDQLACDDCLEFKTEYRDAKDTWQYDLKFNHFWDSTVMWSIPVAPRMFKASSTQSESKRPILMAWRRIGPLKPTTWILGRKHGKPLVGF